MLIKVLITLRIDNIDFFHAFDLKRVWKLIQKIKKKRKFVVNNKCDDNSTEKNKN